MQPVHVFRDITNGIFTSPNADYLPVPPTPSSWLLRLSDGLKTRWAYDDMFYLALVPLQVRYDLPMLACLSPTSMNIIQVNTEKGKVFRMEDKLCRQWLALERVVVELQKRLLRRCPGTYLLTVAPPYPSSFGYACNWTTEDDATKSTRLARTAFTLRFAFVSYLVMKETLKDRPVWQDLTQKGADPLPLSICNTLRASWICDFDVRRVGAFVDISNKFIPDASYQWHDDIHDMLRIGVPIWFGYGTHASPDQRLKQSSITNTLHRDYQPRRPVYDVLTAVIHKEQQNDILVAQSSTNEGDKSSSITELSSYYGYLLQSPRNAPTEVFVRRRGGQTTRYMTKLNNEGTLLWRLSPNQDEGESMRSHDEIVLSNIFFQSRQRPRETYQQFTQREDLAAVHLKRVETRKDREKRLAREEQNRDQPVPRSRGPTVFVWLTENGIQYRRQVRTRDIQGLWEQTSPIQRRYNSLRNEYDVDNTAHDNRADLDELPQPIEVEPIGPTRSETRHRSVSPIPRTSQPIRRRSPIRTPEVHVENVSGLLQTTCITCLTIDRNYWTRQRLGTT